MSGDLETGGLSVDVRARAIVVFTGETTLPWLRILRSGFRHCYAIIESNGQWILYNPASHQTEIYAMGAAPMHELVNWLFTEPVVLAVWKIHTASKKVAPHRPYTCVEALKRALGIQARYILTPWQLYKYLIKNEK